MRALIKSKELVSTDPNCALIIVDVQNDFCPDGALPVAEGDEVVPVINVLQHIFPRIILTADWHPDNHISFAANHPGVSEFTNVEVSYGAQTLWPKHCVRGTSEADFHNELHTDRADLILRKGQLPDMDSYSAFFDNDRKTPTGLGAYLSEVGVHSVYLVGLATDFCIYHTAIDSRRLGFETFVVEDACKAIDIEASLSRARTDMVQRGASLIHSSVVNI